jgi:MFS family permease
MLFSILTGIFVMSMYSATIFKDAGSSLSPDMSTIIVGFILLIGSYVATMLIDRMGRKVKKKSYILLLDFLIVHIFIVCFIQILLITSGLGCSISLSVLGVYFYLQHIDYNVTLISWLPLLSFSMLMFLGAIGILSLPFLILTEVLAQKVC